MDTEALYPIGLFVGALTVAALVGIATRRIAMPYSVALVFVGLAVGVFLPDLHPQVTPELVLVVLLPGLVFDASLRIDLRELRRTMFSVGFLAGPGVLIVAVAVAAALAIGTGLPFELGFIVGAMVAATDPAAVVAAFKRLGVPPRLATVTEGESLFNDGTGLTLFAIAISVLSTTVTARSVVETVVITVVVSAVIGIAVGYVAARLVSTVDDHLIELTISVSAAYGSYLLADLFHESGVIATVIAGIVLGNHGRQTRFSSRGVEALDTVWEFVAFLMTALVFLIVGLSISLLEFAGRMPWVAWGIIGVLVGRAIIVYAMLGVAWSIRPPTSATSAVRTGWLHVLFWSGLRGAVAVALALSLPADIPRRQLLQEITYGIVLFTLIVQGMTIEPLVRRWLRPGSAGHAGQVTR